MRKNMDEEPKKVTIQEILDDADNFSKKWVIERQINLKEHVYKVLDAQLQTIILKVLGLNDHWGKWEVDHCNGRSGNSTIGDYIKETAKDHVASWVKKAIGKLPSIPTDAVKSIRKDFVENVLRELYNIARDGAMTEATRIYDEKIRTFVETSILKDTKGE
jgi:hypothetical protein